MSLKHQFISIVALLLLVSLSLSGGLVLCNNAISVFSDVTIANYDYSQGSSPITSGLISGLSERLKSEFVTFLSFGERIQVKHTEVTPVYTTFSLPYLLDFKLTGEFFTETQQENAKRYAVISEGLARELYFTTDVVGRTLELDRKNYIISGVYAENRGIIHNLSKDNSERIYLPYTCCHTPESLSLDTIIYDSRSNSAAVIEQLNLPQYSFFSLTSKTLVIDTLKKALLFTLYFGALIIFVFIWYKLSVLYFGKLKEILNSYYFFEGVKKKPLTFISFILISVGIPAVFIAVFIVSDFSIYIVPEYTPYDNIFDIGHYLSAYLTNHSILNSLSLSGEKYYLNFYSTTFSSVLWLWLMFCVLYAILLYRVFRVLRDNVSVFGKS